VFKEPKGPKGLTLAVSKTLAEFEEFSDGLGWERGSDPRAAQVEAAEGVENRD
jgi:hypothetical protein